MHALRGERLQMRIYVAALDRHGDRPVMPQIVELLRERGCAGATVLQSVMAFGARRIVHSELNEITSLDLPAVIECVDAPERIAGVMPEIDAMIDSGLITLERAEVLIYRGHTRAPNHEHSNEAPAVSRPAGEEESLRQHQEPGGAPPMSTHGFKGERTLMRIHVGERDRTEGKPLYEAIVLLLRHRGFAGATVLRGVMGFGAHATVHASSLFRLSSDLPIVIEVIETEERIRSILPELDGMIDGGLITLERARVILYRPGPPPDEGDAGWSVDVTGNWRVQPPPG